ncbi:MAG TPA: trypsin-like peptidase domain-containing protein [Dehalococcoidia bacterium]
MHKSVTRLAMAGLVLLAMAGAACREGNGGSAAATQPTPTAQAESSRNSTTPAAAEGSPLSVVDVVERVRPSVVHIQAQGLRLGGGRSLPASGVGTGVIWDDAGHIVTNNHVVTLDSDVPAERFIVSLTDGRTVEARLVGRDEMTDLAVIKIDADNLTPAAFGDSDAMKVGEPVVAIGHALDLEGGPTVTTGVVSAKDRSLQVDTAEVSLAGLIQTDAAINPGNSGGPLVNLRGEVIGINTAAARDTGTTSVQGIGFAVPSNTVREVAQQIIRNGRVRRGTLGIMAQDVTPAVARNMGIQVEHGVLVVDLVRGGPADRAGLRAGDVIVSVAGEEVQNLGELADVLLRHPPGETVSVEYVRGNDTETARVTLTEPQP